MDDEDKVTFAQAAMAIFEQAISLPCVSRRMRRGILALDMAEELWGEACCLGDGRSYECGVEPAWGAVNE